LHKRSELYYKANTFLTQLFIVQFFVRTRNLLKNHILPSIGKSLSTQELRRLSAVYR